VAARKKTARKQATRKVSAAGKTGAKTKPAPKTAGKRRKAAKSGTPKSAAKVAPKKATRKATKATQRARRKTAAVAKRSAQAAPEVSAFPEIEALAELMEKHGLHEVSYTREADGSTSLHVSKGGAPVAFAAAPAPVMQAAPGLPAATVTEGAAAVDAAPVADETLHAFKSPMVGTFYRAPSPEASPFSTTGDNVDPNSVVCIIEAMKVMNEINPDIAGEIVSIEVENGEAVEFGQTLMLLRPR